MATKKSTSKSRSAGHTSAAKKAPKSTAKEQSSSTEHGSDATAQITTDHVVIRRWAEEREGRPAHVKGTGGEGDIGILRIDFPGYSGEGTLAPISWDDWFRKFDERGLAFLYQEQTVGGAKSNFNKIISRETAEEESAKHKAPSSRKTKTAGGGS
jgi:hypothetical protein